MSAHDDYLDPDYHDVRPEEVGVDKPDGTETTAGDWQDEFPAREIRRGLSIRDPAGIMWSAEEGDIRSGSERPRREAREGDWSTEGSIAGGLDRRRKMSVDEGWLLVRCEVVDAGTALGRLVIRPESRCLVFNDGLRGSVLRASRLFGNVVIESKSWRVKNKTEAARDVGEGG